MKKPRTSGSMDRRTALETFGAVFVGIGIVPSLRAPFVSEATVRGLPTENPREPIPHGIDPDMAQLLGKIFHQLVVMHNVGEGCLAGEGSCEYAAMPVAWYHDVENCLVPTQGYMELTGLLYSEPGVGAHGTRGRFAETLNVWRSSIPGAWARNVQWSDQIAIESVVRLGRLIEHLRTELRLAGIPSVSPRRVRLVSHRWRELTESRSSHVPVMCRACSAVS